MKKIILTATILLYLNFINAYYYSSTLEKFFNPIFMLGIVTIILFALIRFSIRKILRGKRKLHNPYDTSKNQQAETDNKIINIFSVALTLLLIIVCSKNDLFFMGGLGQDFTRFLQNNLNISNLYQLYPITLFAIGFVCFFSISFYTLSRILKNAKDKPDTVTAGLVAFAFSMIAIYGIYKMRLNLQDIYWEIENFFYYTFNIDLLTFLIGSSIVVLAIWVLIRIIKNEQPIGLTHWD
jgi:xanthine/uracil permease